MKQDEIKDFLAEQICNAMYMERSELGDDTLFSDFGLESTTLAKILVSVHKKYNYEVKVEEFLTHQTLNSASKFIYQKIGVKTDES